MKHTAPIYPGKYEIKNIGPTPYIYCASPTAKIVDEYEFLGKGFSKDFMKELINIDESDTESLFNFLEKYGPLFNTNSNSKDPTFCGQRISTELANYLSPFEEGVSMPLAIFFQHLELIKNILLLSTEIDLYTSRAFNPNTCADAYKENILNIVKHFINLLYQPYTLKNNVQKTLNWIIGGKTALSRFTQNYHSVLRQNKELVFSIDFMHRFNIGVLALGTVNNDILKATSIDSINEYGNIFIPYKNEIIISETDASVVFDSETITELFANHLAHFLTQDAQKLNCNTPPIFNASFLKTLEQNATIETTYPISETFAEDSISYIGLATLLITLNKYFDFRYISTHEINVKFRNSKNSCSDDFVMEITKFAKLLVQDTINTYISNINFELSLSTNNNYTFKPKSDSLLQSIFLEIANTLNNYQVTLCNLPSCNNLVISHKNRPATCCCSSHRTAYIRWRERRSKNSFSQ